MKLATDLTDYAAGSLGLVEMASSFLNDRTRRMWSKGELIAYANESQWNLAAEINRIHREYFLTSQTTPAMANQAYYSLPTDLVKLMGLEAISSASDREPQEVVSVLLSDRRFYEGLDKATSKDDYRFFFVAGTTMKMLPEAGTVGGELLRMHYVKRLVTLAGNDDVSAIPEQHHGLIAMDMARLALIKTRQTNGQLEKMRMERFDSMQAELQVFTIPREERVEPYWGSWGPDLWPSKQVW